MDQKQQDAADLAAMSRKTAGYPPVGSVWERRNRDGTVERRHVKEEPPAWWWPKVTVAYSGGDDAMRVIHYTSLDAWLNWVSGHEPARMVEPAAEALPPIGSLWEKDGERRRVIAHTTFGWVSFIRDDDIFTESTPLECWHRWAADAAAVEPSRFAQTNFELSRKLQVAEAEKNVAERLVEALKEQLARERKEIDMVDQAIAECQEAERAPGQPGVGHTPAQERVRMIRYYHAEWRRMRSIVSRVHDALVYPPR